MYISHKKNRVQIVKNKYDCTAKRTRTGITVSFKVDPRGLEFTDMPEFVSKNYKEVRIETVLTADEIIELKAWLDVEKASNRAESIQRDWMRLPLLFKRLVVAFEADEITLDDASIARFSALRDLLSDAVAKKIESNERKLLNEDRKEALQKVKLLNAISVLS